MATTRRNHSHPSDAILRALHMEAHQTGLGEDAVTAAIAEATTVGREILTPKKKIIRDVFKPIEDEKKRIASHWHDPAPTRFAVGTLADATQAMFPEDPNE